MWDVAALHLLCRELLGNIPVHADVIIVVIYIYHSSCMQIGAEISMWFIPSF